MFFLPDEVPWPAAGFTCRITPVHAYQLWRLGAPGPQVPTGPEGGASDVRLGNGNDEGPNMRHGANMHEPIILASIDDESPEHSGSPGHSTAQKCPPAMTWGLSPGSPAANRTARQHCM